MKKLSGLIFLSLFISLASFAQTVTVKGTVKDDQGKGLPSINVQAVIKGVKKTVQTDKDGNFSVTVNGTGTVTLNFSSATYKAASAVSDGKNAVNVVLEKDIITTDEVVINVGYGTLRKRELTSSVSSITAKDLKDIPINSAAEALNGRLAGVTATTAEGSPDADVRIKVRGGMTITQDNSPLYIIDGVQVENGLNNISPQDIQSIDVLKDAAATAIYGARGGNGVIVISTKSGKPGKLRVTYNGFVGVKYLPKTLDVLSPYDYVIYQSERSRGNGTDSTNFTKNFGSTWDTLSVYKNVNPVDWQDQVFGRTGIAQTHNITMSGGTNKMTYNFAYTFNNDKAIVINSKFVRHLLNLKGDYKITKKIKLNMGVRYNTQNVYGSGVSDTKGSSYNRLRNAVKYRPFLSNGQDIDDTDPLADPNVGNGLNLVNPVSLANSEYRNKTTDNLNFNAGVSYTIIKNLTFKSTFGYDYKKFTDRQFSDSLTPYSVIQGSKKPIASLDTQIARTYTNTNVLTYSLKNFRKKHDIDFVLGEETYDLRNESHSSLFGQYPLFTSSDKAFTQTNLGVPFAGYPRPVSKTRYTSLSFFSRLNYTFMKRYIFSFNIRADGASKFAPEERWGYFPAGSFAWRVKNEKFMENIKAISEFKFRAGYGTVGNNRMGDYLYLTTFFNDNRYYYGVNNQAIYAYYPGSLPNAKLKWESTENRNLGLDIGFFNRFDLSVDVYDNRSRDLLLNVPIASTYGYVQQLQNIGKTSNKGVELQLNAAILRKKNNLTWNASFNISFNRNRIEALGVNQKSFFPPASWGVSGQPADYIIRVGDPVGSMWGLVTDGFYKVSDFDYNTTTHAYTLKAGVVTNVGIIGPVQPGSIKFKDLNGDGVIDLTNDRQVIGNPTPKFTGGLNQQFTYKNWDASVFLNFSYGNDVYNANKIEFTNGYTNNSNMLTLMENRWKVVTATGQSAQWVNGTTVYGIAPAQLEALNAGATIWQPLKSAGAFYPHSWAIEDGSFLRINNVTIGYTLPVRTLARLHMSKLRFYVTGNNLVVFTNYSGYDPEVSVKNNVLTPGLDYSAYPKSRSFIFGVNASF